MTVAYYQKSAGLNENKKEADNIIKNEKNKEENNSFKPVDIKISADDHIRGDQSASVIMVLFSDLQCPYCSRFHKTTKEVIENYSKKVKVVFKHFPLEQIHPFARPAALAAECAGEQGKFWEYIDDIFSNQGNITTEYFLILADNLKLNSVEFKECLQSEKYNKKIEADLEEGKKAGVKGTPASIINGELISGSLSFDQIKIKIDNLIK